VDPNEYDEELDERVYVFSAAYWNAAIVVFLDLSVFAFWRSKHIREPVVAIGLCFTGRAIMAGSPPENYFLGHCLLFLLFGSEFGTSLLQWHSMWRERLRKVAAINFKRDELGLSDLRESTHDNNMIGNWYEAV